MKESLYYLFLSGLILGTGPCAAFCAPILASYVVVYKNSFNKGVVSYAAFSAGRLISYAILGALCGGLSGILKSAALSGALGTITVIFGTGIALIGVLTILSKNPVAAKYCSFLHKGNVRNAGILGFLAGFSPCLPLLGILNYVIIISHSVLEAVVFILVFGLGTVISPVILLIGLSGKLSGFFSRNQKLERIIRLCAGVFLIFLGIKAVLQILLR